MSSPPSSPPFQRERSVHYRHTNIQACVGRFDIRTLQTRDLPGARTDSDHSKTGHPIGSNEGHEPKMEHAVDPLGPTESNVREVDIDDLRTSLDRGGRQTFPPPGTSGLGGSEKGIELTSRMGFVETHSPSELSAFVVPCGFVGGFDRRDKPLFQLGQAPLSSEDQCRPIDPARSQRKVRSPIEPDR